MAAVGMFDGIHRGHAFLLDELVRKARERGMRPLALTFAVHPKAIVRPGNAPALLGAPEQRCRYITERFGIDADILDLDADSLKMTASQFINYIREKYGVEALLMGYDNHIGSDRRSGADLVGGTFPVEIVPPCPDVEVCSSAVREAIRGGDIAHATTLLGHPFTIAGTVVPGQHLGTKLGFPTANIRPDEPQQLLPADGVYAVDIVLDGHRHRGMANIGKRPTVGGSDRTFEVHIIDFDGDIYGRRVEVEILGRLRDERRFATLSELQTQLASDRLAALSFNA